MSTLSDEHLVYQELDIAGAEIVNDFGVVCLLYADPEQIFLKCWNREKTVGQVQGGLGYLQGYSLIQNRSSSSAGTG